MFDFTYSPRKSQDYKIFVRNSFSDFLDSSSYFIELSKDGFPTIEVNEVVDSNKINKRLFLGDISDDYGFHSLKFFCLRNDSIIYSELLKYNGSNRAVFNFEYDFESLSLKNGDLIRYYFAVKDNDGINGPKEVLSRSMFLKVPSKERQKEIRKNKSLANNQSFSSLRKKLQNFNSELEEMKTSMLNKKSLAWEDKSSLENFIKKQKEMQKELENLKNQLQKEFSESQKEKNKEILKKQQQISSKLDLHA